MEKFWIWFYIIITSVFNIILRLSSSQKKMRTKEHLELQSPVLILLRCQITFLPEVNDIATPTRQTQIHNPEAGEKYFKTAILLQLS